VKHIVVKLLALIALACSLATTARADSFAKRVDIGGGRMMYIECNGSGSPTVVLMSGSGAASDSWHAADQKGPTVYDDIQKTARVCAYDRPDIRVGDDVTTPRSQPHTVDEDVSDLHAFLSALGEPAPYVLVAHSYGGVIATLYARTHPEQVGGLVMVDTVTQLMEGVVSADKLAKWDATNATTSPEVREGVQLIDAFAQINAAPPMPAVPAIVLSADKPWRSDLLPPEAKADEMVTFADWLTALDRLATDLGAEHITETNSGHDIYLYSPALVVGAIRAVVDDVR